MANNLEKTIRLSKTTYERPETTITDTLQSPEAYREKLKGYVEVDNIDFVSIKTHVRYFVRDVEKGQWMFRTGGLLHKKHDKYVILSNGKYSWSVQREIREEKNDNIWETKFFKILTKQELCEMALERQQEEIDRLTKENHSLKSQVYALNK